MVGAGPGGYAAALRAADAGLDVTLVERAQLGGTCLNVGCIPSKALIEVATTRYRSVTGQAHGLIADVSIDPARLNQHLATTSRQLRSGVASLLDDAGVTIVRGDASFARYDRLSIAADGLVSHLEFDNVIIATGSRPVELPALPFGGPVVSSTGALTLDPMPQTMCVIGGGYIGVELGTAWAKLGVSVTIVESAASLLPATAEALRRPVERQLRAIGVDVRTAVTAVAAEAGGVRLSDGSSLSAEVIVVAVGRQPNTDRSGIDTLPIAVSEQGLIEVDQQMRASTGIYAIGDLVAGPALAHKATVEAEIAVDSICGNPFIDAPPIPAVIFSDPEIMSVGVGIDEAPAAGCAVHRFPHSASARARTIGDPSGSTYLVVDQAQTIVGVHAVGAHASELAGEASLAVSMGAVLEDLAGTVHAHPTMAENLGEAALLGVGRPLHIRR